jgi:hypothetical protein
MSSSETSSPDAANPDAANTQRSNLDPRLTDLLAGLRGRIRRFVVWDSVLTLLGLVLAAFWIGLALDYLPVVLGGTEMPRLARFILLILVAAGVVTILWKRLVGRLGRPLPDDSLALLVERHHPELGGRLVTAVQLNRPGRDGDSHSPLLLRQVHQQAAQKIDQVDPARIFQLAPLVKKALIAGPLLLMAIVFLAISPQAFGRAASRLTLLSDDPWPRRAQLEMVGVELPVVGFGDSDALPPTLVPFVDKVVRLPRGSSGSLRIRAKADGGAELPDVCTVDYETIASIDSTQPISASDVFESSGQSNMRRIGRVTNGYQSFLLDGPPLASLSDSVLFSGFRIEAVTPPALTQVQVGVRYPDYLRIDGDARPADSFDRLTDFQAGFRLAEGSDVTLLATSSTPLGPTQVSVRTTSNEDVSHTVNYSEDRRSLRLQIDNFTKPTTASIIPADSTGISAQAPYRYLMGVVVDQPPELKLRLVGIGSAVTAAARIPIEAKVKDDYGIDRLTVSVTPSLAETQIPNDAAKKKDAAEKNKDGNAQSASETPTISRDGEATLVMDLRDLIAEGRLPELTPVTSSTSNNTGDAIQVIGEVTDRYNLNGTHLTRSDVFRLQIVTPEKLLALLERRELALRSRLEQTIDETRGLRDTLNLLGRSMESSPEQSGDNKTDDGGIDDRADEASDQTRVIQVRRLRVQQSGLQATKTAEELSGIAESLDDILLEMVNNRVDSVDRRQRIGTGVRDPLRQIVDDPLTRLQEQITEIERVVADPDQANQATRDAVQTAEEVLLRLTAVLEKMLDLESYNEILDLVRGLIADQESLLEETKNERKRGVLDLFE